MKRKEQIELIFSVVQADLLIIQTLFKRSVQKKKIDSTILIRIKNFLENLRTILDYLAKEILDKNCTKKPRNYFPIIKKGATAKEIDNSISGAFPDLKVTNKKLFDYLVNIQPTNSKNDETLSNFNDLCGKNKHEILTLQIRKDEVINMLTFTSGPAYVWTDGLVDFDTQKNGIIVKPGGVISLSIESTTVLKNGHFNEFGWIVETLHNYNQRSSPDLSKHDKSMYDFKSFLVANFYFPDHKISAYLELELYLSKVRIISQKVYEYL